MNYTAGRIAKNDQQRILDRCIPEPTSGCWLWEGAAWHEDTWALPNVGTGKKGRKALASRVAYAAFVGPIADELFVCHRCDNPMCVNPDHLFLGTGAENMADMARKGRGGRRAGAIPKHLREKIARAPGGKRAIAKRFGVHPETVRYWRNRAALKPAA